MATIDRRMTRTKRVLREALFDLIAWKSFESLTVNEIADHADVGRATFYLHYKDKDDLLQHALTDEFAALAQHMQGYTEPEHRLRHLLEYVSAHSDHFRVLLLSVGKPNIYVFTRNFMAMQLLERLKARNVTNSAIPLELVALHMAGSILNLILWWLENKKPCSIGELETLCIRLVGDGVWKVLDLEPDTAQRTFL